MVHFEDMSFRQQLACIQSSGALVSRHGAALANTLFARRGTLVFEVNTPEEVADGNSVIYSAVCDVSKCVHITLLDQTALLQLQHYLEMPIELLSLNGTQAVLATKPDPNPRSLPDPPAPSTAEADDPAAVAVSLRVRDAQGHPMLFELLNRDRLAPRPAVARFCRDFFALSIESCVERVMAALPSDLGTHYVSYGTTKMIGSNG